MFEYAFVKKDLSLQEDVPILQFILFFLDTAVYPSQVVPDYNH